MSTLAVAIASRTAEASGGWNANTNCLLAMVNMRRGEGRFTRRMFVRLVDA